MGLEGNFASNTLVKQADLVLNVGTRLTDFATGSQSIFENPDVRFASLNIVDADTRKQGATGILADARLGLEALAQALEGHSTSEAWQDTVHAEKASWAPIRSTVAGRRHRLQPRGPPGRSGHRRGPDTAAADRADAGARPLRRHRHRRRRRGSR